MPKRIGFMLVAIFVVLDQFTKYLVEIKLPFQESVSVMPFLSWFRTYNEGVAFSFLASLNDWALVGSTIVVIGFVLWLWSKLPASRFYSHLGFAFVLGGAIGNLVDRAMLGYVVDFVQFHTLTWSFAIFNLADVFINMGAALIILDELFGKHKPEETNPATDQRD